MTLSDDQIETLYCKLTMTCFDFAHRYGNLITWALITSRLCRENFYKTGNLDIGTINHVINVMSKYNQC